MGARSAVASAVVVWMGLLAGVAMPAPMCTAALALALALAPLAWSARPHAGTAALLLALALAAAARGSAHHGRLEVARAALRRGGGVFRIEGSIDGPPLRASGEPVALVRVDRASPALPRGARVRVRLPAGDSSEWGDRVRALARLDLPLDARDPGGYDALAAAEASGVCATGRAPSVERLGVAAVANWPRATAARARRALEAVYATSLDSTARTLVVPLVTGDRSDMAPGLEADFRASGLVHLLALSGLHVAWLAALARGIAAALGGGTWVRAVSGAACALAYIGIAGPLPSLARAAVGEMLTAAARLRGRALDPVQCLAVTALALLVIAPGWSRDLGFQLSFAATLGLVTVGAWLDARAGRWRRVTSVFTPTLGAQVVALPILLGRFHAVSWVAPLANLVAVPISGLLLAAAWTGALLEFAWPGAGRWCLDACAPLALAFRMSATLAARVPGALSPCGSEPSMAVLAAIGAALLAWALASRRTLLEREARTPQHRRLAAMAGAWCCALAMLLAWSARPLSPGPGCMWVVVLDVGQGDCIAIAKRGAWWLVDAGPRSYRFDAGESVVLPFLRWAGVRRLEGLAVTHDDNDHRGGVPALRRDVAIARLWAAVPRPGAPGPAARFDAVTAARGDTLAHDPLLRVLWPPREGAPLDDALSGAGNQASLVLEVGQFAGRALLLADADSLVEAALVVVPGIALLKAGHHGASSSSGGVFAHRLSPRVAVFASGRRNPFGHPDPGALGRMRAAGARIDRTDRSGACWYELDAAGWRDVDWRHERPGALRASTARARAGLHRAPRRE